MIKFLTDTLDKPSSKRIAGLSCIATSLLVSIYTTVADFLGSNVNENLIETVLNNLLFAGTVLLGVGVVEKFGTFKNKKTTKNEKMA